MNATNIQISNLSDGDSEGLASQDFWLLPLHLQSRSSYQNGTVSEGEKGNFHV